MADDEIRAARATRKIEKTAAKAEAQRRREERIASEAASPPKEVVLHHPVDAALYAYLLAHPDTCDHIFERLIDPPWYTSGTAMRAILVCDAIFGPEER